MKIWSNIFRIWFNLMIKTTLFWRENISNRKKLIWKRSWGKLPKFKNKWWKLSKDKLDKITSILLSILSAKIPHIIIKKMITAKMVNHIHTLHQGLDQIASKLLDMRRNLNIKTVKFHNKDIMIIIVTTRHKETNKMKWIKWIIYKQSPIRIEFLKRFH